MEMKRLFYRMAVVFSMLFYSVLAQDGSQIQADGSTQEQAGFEEVMLDYNELAADNIKTDPVLNGLHPDYWRAELNSSSDYDEAKMLTFTKRVALPQSQIQNLFVNNGNTGSVLGVRIFFPSVRSNSHVTIRPDKEIIPYSQDNNPNPFKNKGLIENVSAIKSISSFVFGLNYPYTLSVNLKDTKNVVRNFPLGSLHFTGWKQLDYVNRNYLSDIRDRALKLNPDYPANEHYTFDSYVVTKLSDDPAGNFVTYFSWLKVRFDKARVNQPQETLDHDSYWQINKYEAMKRYENLKAKERYMDDLIEAERRKMNLPPLNRPSVNSTTGAAAPNAPARQ